jgi:hypothetical protein
VGQRLARESKQHADYRSGEGRRPGIAGAPAGGRVASRFLEARSHLEVQQASPERPRAEHDGAQAECGVDEAVVSGESKLIGEITDEPTDEQSDTYPDDSKERSRRAAQPRIRRRPLLHEPSLGCSGTSRVIKTV